MPLTQGTNCNSKFTSASRRLPCNCFRFSVFAVYSWRQRSTMCSSTTRPHILLWCSSIGQLAASLVANVIWQKTNQVSGKWLWQWLAKSLLGKQLSKTLLSNPLPSKWTIRQALSKQAHQMRKNHIHPAKLVKLEEKKSHSPTCLLVTGRWLAFFIHLRWSVAVHLISFETDY